MGEYIRWLSVRKKLALSTAHIGKLRQTSGLSDSSEINGGWIIYAPKQQWEKCLCSLCVKVM